MSYSPDATNKKEAKEWRLYKKQHASLSFAEYSADRLAAYRVFQPARMPPRNLLCAAPNGRCARNYFSNLYAETDLFVGDAARIDMFIDPKEIFSCWHVDIDSFFHIGLNRAVETGDAMALLDGLEQKLRYRYLSKCLHRLDAGKKFFLAFFLPKHGILVNDHTAFKYDVLAAYACGRPDFARCFFRQGMGLSELEFDCMVNLCMAIMYDDALWQENALAQAAAESKKTTSKTNKARIAFFTNIIHQDAKGVNDALAILAQARPSAVWGDSWLRFCNIYHHGLCAFAKHHLSPEVFARISLPATAGWWPEIAERSMRTPAQSRPANIFQFAGELSFMDELAMALDKDCSLYA